MKRVRFLLIAVVAITIALPAYPKALPISPVQQNLSYWCWLAVGEMIFKYYHVPNVNPAGDYQCGLAAAVFGGPCMHDCRICNVGSGTVDRIGQMLNGYPAFVRNIAHRNSPDIDTNVVYSALVKDDVVSEIDAGRPIVAGISPHSGFLPPGLSEHAVLIVGHEENEGSIDILVNDPFPYTQAGIQDPYTQVGGKRVVPGRYRISLDAMVSDLAWGNSITGIDTQ